MLSIQHLSYAHPNEEPLFMDLNLTLRDHEKIALVGNNGSGKSTLLTVLAGKAAPLSGQINFDTLPYYIPQHFGQYDQLSIAEALQVDVKLNALYAILDGNLSDENYRMLDDDWTIEERCNKALQHWQLAGLDMNRKMGTLSGGQKTRIFLSGIAINEPALVLLDEPSNHLDLAGRDLLYRFIQSTDSSLIVVSHDRKLLNLLDTVWELGKDGIIVYGGNYDFFKEQKEIEKNAFALALQASEKALRKAKEKERKVLEQQQRSDNRGKGKQEKAGVARIMMNTLRNKAENSTSKVKDVHADKIGGLSQQVKALRSTVPDADAMKMDFAQSNLHNGKVLFEGKDINFRYNEHWLWEKPLMVHITSGQRLAVKGPNGSGKTTLLEIITGKKDPQAGTFYRADFNAVYIDQDYSLINNRLTVYEQAQKFSDGDLAEHEIKTRLNRFLFTKAYWDNYCSQLSGGEKMRLTLCCLTLSSRPPELVILDEPTNNLDIQNIEILANAVNEYKGTLIVVSHDETFLQQVNMQHSVMNIEY